MGSERKLTAAALLGALALTAGTIASDWPMWRRDAQRSARSPEALPEELHLYWVRHLPPLEPAFRNGRLGFDAGYEPVVMGKTLFVGSSRNDSVRGLDTESGDERWRFYAEGPVRLAPVASEGKVFFGADDGCLYSLDAETGTLHWKFRAVPSGRTVLGNGRLISVWPVRGGPVQAGGEVYFAAGVWPFEGVFVYALDARSGEVIWVNDRAGFVYGDHPHDAEALGGLAPQGYLAINGDELIVPCGPAFPATFDLGNGKLRSFALPRKSRLPGGWFVVPSKEARRGELTFDSEVNRDQHEDRVYQGPGLPGKRSSIALGGREYRFGDGWEGVGGAVHALLAADGKLFVVTRKGSIYCFGADAREATTHALNERPLPRTQNRWAAGASEVLSATRARRGFALIWGFRNGRLVEELALQSDLRIVAVDRHAAKVDALRRRLDDAGLYGAKVSLRTGSPADVEFPPYMASLIISEDPMPAEAEAGVELVRRAFRSLRPYGGAAVFSSGPEGGETIASWAREAKLVNAEVQGAGSLTLLTRPGPLPGSADYAGGWKSPDELVRSPLGLLWFDDSLGHFKRSPQPKFIAGLMISRPKEWRGGKKTPYSLMPAVVSDMYTGRILSPDEVSGVERSLLERDERPQPVQYRPGYHEGNPWQPMAPDAGERVNPLTGGTEKRSYPRSYGCDGGIDYGHIVTMRSGTAAYYDKRTESGTIHVSGPRSGCTNSLIPAGGLLNVPYFYEGCTCSYPLPAGLALVSMPPEYEQWAAWGEGDVGPIQRVGINLGAPGDRMAEGGTLWLDFPSVGGPSPQVAVILEPQGVESYYRHSLWIEGGRGWPWVVSSGVEGLSTVVVRGLKSAPFTVRLYFAELDEGQPGARVFDVSIQGRPVLEDFDVAEEAGGALRALVREFRGVRVDGTLRVTLKAEVGPTLLSGIEAIADGLPLGDIPILEERRTKRLYAPRR